MGILPSSLDTVTFRSHCTCRSFQIKNHVQMYIYFHLRGTCREDGEEFHRIRESLNGLGWKGCQSSCHSNPLPWAGPPPTAQVAASPIRRGPEPRAAMSRSTQFWVFLEWINELINGNDAFPSSLPQLGTAAAPAMSCASLPVCLAKEARSGPF